jgi:predicted metal-dependent peptidase
MLYRYLVSVISKGYSFIKPSPGPFQNGFSIPGFRKRTQSLDLAMAIDTSGSMTMEELATVVSEILGLLRQMPGLTITLWTFDHHVYENSVMTIRNTDRNAIEAIKPFLVKMEGGGGTMFESNWDFMKRKRIKPKVFLMATDGLPNRSWGDPSYCRTIFMIFNENKGIRAPFGKTVHYEGNAQ